jgi:exosortase H (IPTLxxWG-CTERM-specific)
VARKRKQARTGFWRRHRALVRSWLTFAAALAVAHVLLDIAIGDWFWDRLNAWTAKLTAWCLAALGAEGRSNGPYVTSNLFGIEVIRECTAVHPLAIFVAAVLAYPCALRPKLAGIVLGTIALVAINQVRLVSLCYVGHWYPQAFETAHLLVWQSLIIFLTVVLWIAWALTLARRHEIRSA